MTTTPGQTTQDILDARYGRVRSPRRRAAIVIGLAVVVVAVGLFGWMTFADSADSVSADTSAFNVVDEHSVMLDFQISAPAGRAVACAIEAQDEQHGVVGLARRAVPRFRPAREGPARGHSDHCAGHDGFGQLLLGDVVCRDRSRYAPWHEPGRLTYRPSPADRRSQTCPAMPR